MAVAVESPTAMKPALASAATTRVPASTSKLVVTAPRACTTTNAVRKATSARRRGQRRLTSASVGAPTAIPTANAVVSRPASESETSRSAAISGTRPASMNSDVPCANTATARA